MTAQVKLAQDMAGLAQQFVEQLTDQEVNTGYALNAIIDKMTQMRDQDRDFAAAMMESFKDHSADMTQQYNDLIENMVKARDRRLALTPVHKVPGEVSDNGGGQSPGSDGNTGDRQIETLSRSLTSQVRKPNGKSATRHRSRHIS